jgi:hypothetical protein
MPPQLPHDCQLRSPRLNVPLGHADVSCHKMLRFAAELSYNRPVMDTAPTMKPSDSSRQFLRHAIATLAYRGGKALRGAPAGFAEYRPFETSRTAGQILAHLGDLLDWALTQAQGKPAWHNSAPLSWHAGSARFFAALQALDDQLASDAPLGCAAEQLFQGAIADSLTHVGQLTMLRRMAGAPIRSENYSQAEIVAGRVTEQQTTPRREFD